QPLEPNQRARQLYHVLPTINEGKATVNLRGVVTPGGKDSVERSFRVVSDGFPTSGAQGGVLDGVAQHTINLPDRWDEGTLQVEVQAFPSSVAELQQGREALLGEPNGSFEQTSATTYPNVLILEALRKQGRGGAAVEERARRLIDAGYQRLLSFECE